MKLIEVANNELIKDILVLIRDNKIIGAWKKLLAVEEHGTSPELEKIRDWLTRETASNPKLAYWYALIIINGRWPPGEKAIASKPESAYGYARFVLKGRWPRGEKAITSDLYWAKEYREFIDETS